MFTPIGFTDTLHIPGANGGALFGDTAAEPTTGMVNAIGQNNPGLLRLLKPGELPGSGTPGMAVYIRDCQVCHAPDRSGTQADPPCSTSAAASMLPLSGRRS